MHQGVGSNWQVMTKSNAKQRRRASRRGATEANGGMAVHRDAAAIDLYTKEELKCVRSYGFEEAVFVLGERGLIAVKEQDPEATATFKGELERLEENGLPRLQEWVWEAAAVVYQWTQTVLRAARNAARDVALDPLA